MSFVTRIEKMIGDTDVARSSSDPRKSASLSCWITNGSVGAPVRSQPATAPTLSPTAPTAL